MMFPKGQVPASLICIGLAISGCARAPAPVQTASPPPIVWTPAPLAEVTPVPVRPVVPQYEAAQLYTVPAPAPAAVMPIPAAPDVEEGRRIGAAPAFAYNDSVKYAAEAIEKNDEQRADLPREDTLKLAKADVKVEKASKAIRTETALPKRRILGSFVTRDETKAEAKPPIADEPSPIVAKKPTPQTFAEWHVAQAPVPEGKPYILRQAPVPPSKPSRVDAPVERDFAVGTATLMAAANIPDLPASIPTRTQPIRLNDRSFATPGKPSVLGTDQDTAIDVVAIDAAPYGIGSIASEGVSSEGADVKWSSAVRLIETGEVQGLSILDEESLLLTLCTGRSVMTAPPDLTSVTTVVAPEIICGRRARLAIE